MTIVNTKLLFFSSKVKKSHDYTTIDKAGIT